MNAQSHRLGTGALRVGTASTWEPQILADPRNPNMKDIVNAKIKFREPYRPFAPSVIAECAEKYFELPQAQCHDSRKVHAVCGAGSDNQQEQRAGDHPR